MKKHLLFIPLLALLGVSCSGEHITTTPIVNTPRAGVLNAPKRLASNNLDNHSISCIDMGSLNWATNPTYGFYAFAPTNMAPVENNGQIAKMFCDLFTTDNYNRVYNNTTDNTIALSQPVSLSPNGLIAVKCDNYTNPQIFKSFVSGHFLNYQNNGTPPFYYEDVYQEGYTKGYEEGEQDGYYSESNKLIPNGMYTGLTIFPRRHYLEDYAVKVMSGQVDPENGQFYLIDTNANYTIEMKWTYNDNEKVTTFYSYGDLLIGELDWHDVAEGYWNSTWFGKYDAELHHFIDTKNYATNGPIETSFYPEIYLGSTFTGGDPNLYFAGGGNAYQMGFADGQTYTIHASETYNNVFTIFTPAFRAVADFFNLNIGPFKVWYFFAIPLIVTLLILVLRLVKH